MYAITIMKLVVQEIGRKQTEYLSVNGISIAMNSQIEPWIH